MHQQPWPVADESKLVTAVVPLVVQILGTKRAVVDVPVAVMGDAAAMEAAARALPEIDARLRGRTVKRVIVAQRIVNFVLEKEPSRSS